MARGRNYFSKLSLFIEDIREIEELYLGENFKGDSLFAALH